MGPSRLVSPAVVGNVREYSHVWQTGKQCDQCYTAGKCLLLKHDVYLPMQQANDVDAHVELSKFPLSQHAPGKRLIQFVLGRRAAVFPLQHLNEEAQAERKQVPAHSCDHSPEMHVIFFLQSLNPDRLSVRNNRLHLQKTTQRDSRMNPSSP